MDQLVNLLMERYGFTRASAEAYAKQMSNSAMQRQQQGNAYGDFVQQGIDNVSRRASNAQGAADIRKDQIVNQLIPGPKPQAPGRGPTPFVAAFNQGRDQVWNEAQDPLMAASLRIHGMYDNAHTTFQEARKTRDSVNTPSKYGPEVDARAKQYMIDYLNETATKRGR